MKSSSLAWLIIFCQAAATLIGGDAFVFSKSSIRRAAALSEGRGDALHDATTAQLERIVGGPVVDLRGGKTTTGSKKASSSKKGSKSSPPRGKKSSKPSKSKKEPKKPSFFATIRAFFKSLIDPHFALKLQAKKEKHNTVHGSGSA